jgi:hypothetical protein
MKIVSNRFANFSLAFGLALFSNFSAQAQITVDGTRDAEYGAALAVQTCGTGFGAGSGGSSLANAYAINDGTFLYLFIGGNIEGNYNKFLIFIDSKTGGQNTLNFTSGPDGTSSLTNLKFDSSFEADYFIVFRWGGSSSSAYADLSTLGASGSPVTTSPIISGGSFLQGISWAAINNASDGPTASGPGNSANVTTGMEFKIPLSLIGSPSSSVKVSAFISGGGNYWVSNQFLAGLPIGTGNLGDSAASRDLTTYPENQFFTVSAPAIVDTDADTIPDSIDLDDDGDGLDDTVETNTGVFIDVTNTGTNPLLADTDSDGFNDGAEIKGTSSLARVTSPFKKNFATLMVAGDFLTPAWSDVPTSANTMTWGSGQEFDYTLDYNFRATTTVNFKFLANSWANNWGGSAGVASTTAGNIAYAPSATGFHTFSFNHNTLTYSIVRKVFPNYAFYAEAYGLTGDEAADDDSDGITNGAEFSANTDPTRANDALAPVITLSGDALVGVALNASYADAGATATDNVDTSVTVNSSGTVDTATVGTYTITYSATDVAGNAAVTKTRTVVVYDSTAGFASRFASVAVPGSFIAWAPNGDQGNSMTLVANFKWKFLYDFTSASSIDYKIVGNAAGAAQGWDSPYKWGQGGVFGAGNNASASVTPGRYAFELDEVLNSASLTRVGDLPPSGLSYTPSSASGTVGTPISSLTPTVTGTVTSYSVSPTLPLGLTFNTSSGVISGTPSVAASSADYTVTATNGTGSTTATVTIEVAAAPVGSTFAGAYPGASMTDVAPNGLTYLANYAFGGNETTPATLPVQDTSDPTKLRLVVVFRTDDNSLTLGGQASTGLEAAWSSAGVTVVDGDSTGLSANMARKVISVDRGSDPKKFLRATVTK